MSKQKEVEGIMFLDSKELGQLLLAKSICEIDEKEVLPISVKIIGDAGLSKSSLVRKILPDLIREHYGKDGEGNWKKNVNVGYINLAEAGTDIGPLLGYPKNEMQLLDGSWKPEKTLTEEEKLLTTGRSRQVYSPPSFLTAFKEGENEINIFLLDDVGRAQQLLLNAIMEVMEEGKFSDWRLPKGTLVFATANFDHNSSNANWEDKAQKTRYQTYYMGSIDIEEWAKWAETQGIHYSLISYIVHNWDNGQIMKTVLENNIRIVTKWAKTMSGLVRDFMLVKNKEKPIAWSNPSFYNTASKAISVACFGKNGHTIQINFWAEFVHKVLANLTNVEEHMFKTPVEDFKRMLEKDFGNAGDGIGYSPLKAQIQYKRILHMLEKRQTFTAAENKYIIDLFLTGTKVFGPSIMNNFQNHISHNVAKFTRIRTTTEYHAYLSKII